MKDSFLKLLILRIVKITGKDYLDDYQKNLKESEGGQVVWYEGRWSDSIILWNDNFYNGDNLNIDELREETELITVNKEYADHILDWEINEIGLFEFLVDFVEGDHRLITLFKESAIDYKHWGETLDFSYLKLIVEMEYIESYDHWNGAKECELEMGIHGQLTENFIIIKF